MLHLLTKDGLGGSVEKLAWPGKTLSNFAWPGKTLANGWYVFYAISTWRPQKCHRLVSCKYIDDALANSRVLCTTTYRLYLDCGSALKMTLFLILELVCRVTDRSNTRHRLAPG
jgi:hypothetical protein